MARDEKLEMLRSVPLFAGMSARDLRHLGALTDEIDLPDGRVLTREGKRGDEFFIVVDGSVQVTVAGKVVNRLGPGDFLGEISLIDGKPRTATATTVGPTRLLLVGHREFNTLMTDYPSVERCVLLALAKRVRQTDLIQ
jgi:CRP-like cAMP-binding protein